MRAPRLVLWVAVSVVSFAVPVTGHGQFISPEVRKAFNSSRSEGDTLRALYDALRKQDDGKWDSKLYFYSTNNHLESDWLLQTPNVWGLPADEVKPGAGKFMPERIKELVAGAERWVDITSLAPFPTGAFENAIVEGLVELTKTKRRVVVRILVGWWTDDDRVDEEAYLKRIVARIKDLPTNGFLHVYVARQWVPARLSWNHSKIVAVDGKRAIVGGQNLWDADYLQLYPAHDLNVALRGSFAIGMHNFADEIWAGICGRIAPAGRSVSWHTGMGNKIDSGCTIRNLQPRIEDDGTVAVLGVGRLGALNPDSTTDPADTAIVLALGSASSTLRISQQDLGFQKVFSFFWDGAMDAIASVLAARKHVYIVLTNDGAKAGTNGNDYSGATLAETADKIAKYVEHQGVPRNELTDLLCTYLHLAPLRFGASDKWPNGWTFANHAKFFTVDEKLFYVGSENLYGAANHMEYGVFLNDRAAMTKMKQDYWDKLWQFSSRAAISGSEAPKCHFRKGDPGAVSAAASME